MTELDAIGSKIRQTINAKFVGPDAEKPLKLILFDVSWALDLILREKEAAEKKAAEASVEAESEFIQAELF